jgi:hypothetical protein
MRTKIEQPTLQVTASASPDSAAPAGRTAHDATRRKAPSCSGDRCRLYANPATGLCRHHTFNADNPPDIDLTSDFDNLAKDLTSAWAINLFLTRLANVTIQNRISTRRAAVLAYMANQLIHTLPAVDLELERAEMEANYQERLIEATINQAAPPDPDEPPKTYFDVCT